MANASQVASAGVYVTDDIGLEVTDGSNSRVQLGLLPSGTYGLRVVTSGGTTVIIDGTSDMFKISATGTATVTEATGNADATNDTTLSSLGTFTNTPAGQIYVAFGSAATSNKGFIDTLSSSPAGLFAASSSGGSPTTRIVNLVALTWGVTLLNGSSQVVARMVLQNDSGASQTSNGRYYVLAEVGM